MNAEYVVKEKYPNAYSKRLKKNLQGMSVSFYRVNSGDDKTDIVLAEAETRPAAWQKAKKIILSENK